MFVWLYQFQSVVYTVSTVVMTTVHIINTLLHFSVACLRGLIRSSCKICTRLCVFFYLQLEVQANCDREANAAFVHFTAAMLSSSSHKQ